MLRFCPHFNLELAPELERLDKITDFVRGNVTVISIIPESR